MKGYRQEIGVEIEAKRRSPFRSFFRPISYKNISNFIFPTVYAQQTSLPVPFFKPNYDAVKSPPKTTPVEETGLDRLKQMFSTDDYGQFGPEWSMVVQGTYGGIIAGTIIGGLSGGRKAKENHLNETQATKYHTEMHARRALQDKMTLGFIRGAAQFGLKMGTFSFLYIFTTTVSSVYRGKTNLFDFVAGGLISGVLWRITHGPKAALVTGGFGSILGLFCGGLSLMVMSLSGTSFEELRYWHYHAHAVKRRSEVFGNEMEEKEQIVTKEVDPLQEHHNKLVEARTSSTEIVSSPPEAVDPKTKTSS